MRYLRLMGLMPRRAEHEAHGDRRPCLERAWNIRHQPDTADNTG